MRSIDLRASRQHGVISRAQAIEAVLSPRQIEYRVTSGRWQKVGRGVYRVAGAPVTWQQTAMVACLATRGTASHLSAAALLGLATPPVAPHVTVPRGSSPGHPGATVHRSTLAPGDRCLVGPVPCTRPARTLVDCASVVAFPELCDLVDGALCAGLTDVGRVTRALVPGRRGRAALERALAPWADGPSPGSPAEMRLLRRLVSAGFPEPARQFVVRDDAGRFVARVDLAWPGRRLALEYDGRRWHGPRRWAADADREGRLEALGWRIRRIGSTTMAEELAALQDSLRVA